jgi:hypothetical protein
MGRAPAASIGLRDAWGMPSEGSDRFGSMGKAG